MPWWLWLAPFCGIVLAVASLHVPVNHDEAWALQVVRRCLRGEALYRDTFYGAGPLPVWLAVAASRAARPQGIVLRGLDISYFLGQLAAGSWALDQAGAPVAAVAALWVASIACSGPSWWAGGHYTALSAAAMAFSAAAALRWSGTGSVVWALAAGAGGGAVMAAKQNAAVGTAGLALVVVAEGGLAPGLAFCSAAIGVVIVCLAPVWRQGALRCYLEQGFLNKRVYRRDGRISFREGLRQAIPPRSSWLRPGGASQLVAASSFAILPVLVVTSAAGAVTLLGGDLSPATRATVLVGLVLALASLWLPYPRVDAPHVQFVFPVGLLAVLLVWTGFGQAFQWRPPGALGAIGLGAAVLWAGVSTVVSLATRPRFRAHEADRRFPHFRGLPVHGYWPGQSPVDADDLRRLTGGTVLVLRPDAALWYIGGGLVNPTRYDYPYSTVFGPRGQQETIERIRAGEIAWVCSPGMPAGRLRPVALEQFVTEEMDVVAQTAGGTLYRPRSR